MTRACAVMAALMALAMAGSASAAAFPRVDYRTLTIRLERGLCFGACPAYVVEIKGDGRVLWNGADFVAVKGERRRTIPRAAVRRLVSEFRRAGFFGLQDEYRARVTDLPTTTITFSTSGESKAVLDYWGERAGMPASVTRLERSIDQAAGTAEWIGRRR